MRWHDLTRPIVPCKPFDAVLSLEVAEHIPVAFERVYLQNLACSCKKFLVLSWAPPGQGGSGHVNPLRPNEAHRRVEALGFRFLAADSHALRLRASLPWFRRNLAVFERQRSSLE